eukprot:15472977-Alexandrium_andersonii.AAC.1
MNMWATQIKQRATVHCATFFLRQPGRASEVLATATAAAVAADSLSRLISSALPGPSAADCCTLC